MAANDNEENSSNESNVVDFKAKKEKSLEERLFDKQPYQIVDENAAPLLVYLPDLHEEVEILQYSIDEARKVAANDNQTIYVGISDEIQMKGNRQQDLMSLGLGSKEMFEASYSLTKFNELREKAINENNLEKANDIEEDMQIMQYMAQISMMGGPNQFMYALSQDQEMPQDVKNQQIDMFQEVVDKYEKRGIQAKLDEIFEENKEEIEANLETLKFYTRAANEVLDEVVYENLGKVLAANDNVKAIVGGGNHGTRRGVRYLQDILGDDKVHYLYDVHGAIKLGKGEEQIATQIAGNWGILEHVTDKWAYENEVEAAIEYGFHYFDQQVLVEGANLAKRKNMTLEEAIKSIELQRLLGVMVNGGQIPTEKLDWMNLHEEDGDLRKDYEYTGPNVNNMGIQYFLDNFVKRDKDGNIIVDTGHLHKDAQFVNEDLKQRVYRHEAKIRTKDGVKILDVHNLRRNPRANLEELVPKIQARYEELRNQYNLENEVVEDTEYKIAA